jgi:hypothetical protein
VADSITPSIFGLVGVLVGGIITAGANYLLAVRKEKAEKAERSHVREAETKKAARIVDTEIEFALRVYRTILEKGKWPPQIIEVSFSWDKYKETFALAVSNDAWAALVVAEFALARLKEQLITMHDAADRDISEAVHRSVINSIELLEDARRHIGPLIA